MTEDEKHIISQNFPGFFPQVVPVEKTIMAEIDLKIRLVLKDKGLNSSPDVEYLYGQFALHWDIAVEKILSKLVNVTAKWRVLTNKPGKTVTPQDFMAALVLFYLSECKHDINQIREKITSFYPSLDLDSVICQLLEYKLIENQSGYYRINIAKLLDSARAQNQNMLLETNTEYPNTPSY